MLGFYGDNGKENGNYYIGVIYTLLVPFCLIGTILGFYKDDGKENGNYYVGVIYTLLVPFCLSHMHSWWH